MKLFIDTGSVAEVEEIAAWGVLSGATTNPSLLAKEQDADPGESIRRICELVDGPVSGEVVSEDARRLKLNLGQSDRVRLDEYLESVRALERQIATSTQTTISVHSSTVSTWSAMRRAPSSPCSVRQAASTGTKAWLKAPSPKMRRNRLGIRKATK